uniref:MlaD family protein n=1 Tax=Nocardia neocaledoniensis TaxID=236511 RepID=UPI0024564788
MQRLKFFSGDRPIMDEATKRARELRMGIIGLGLVVLFIIGAGIVYVVPLGKHTYTAELSEAQSVREGDDVRLAGISVGSVTSLELKPDKVLMEFTVDREVFVGDQTSLDIRMLTVVGGHYVALYPAGGRPQGGAPHPPRPRQFSTLKLPPGPVPGTPHTRCSASTHRTGLATFASNGAAVQPL